MISCNTQKIFKYTDCDAFLGELTGPNTAMDDSIINIDDESDSFS